MTETLIDIPKSKLTCSIDSMVIKCSNSNDSLEVSMAGDVYPGILSNQWLHISLSGIKRFDTSFMKIDYSD